jgi:hypothetical protein
MTDDRELLSLAAKAAGYYDIDGWSGHPEKGMRWVDDDRNFVRYWNPLLDDGDMHALQRDAQSFARQQLSGARNKSNRVFIIQITFKNLVANLN